MSTKRLPDSGASSEPKRQAFLDVTNFSNVPSHKTKASSKDPDDTHGCKGTSCKGMDPKPNLHCPESMDSPSTAKMSIVLNADRSKARAVAGPTALTQSVTINPFQQPSLCRQLPAPAHSHAAPSSTATSVAQSQLPIISSLSIHDIDANDMNEPQLCAEYVNEIYGILLQKEKKEREWIKPYLGELQKEISNGMRSILVDWLVEVVEEYSLSTDTLFLAVNYIDRFLSAVVVPKSRLQLVGIACTLVASKYEDIYAPTVEDFVYISDNTYKRDEILVMESQILNVLRFRLTVTTARLFLKRFLKAACADHVIAASSELPVLASYLSELSLLSYEMCVHYEPSLIATSCIVAALHTLNLPFWTPTLEYYTDIRRNDGRLHDCVKELVKIYQNFVGNTQLNAIREKYSKLLHKITPPSSAPVW